MWSQTAGAFAFLQSVEIHKLWEDCCDMVRHDANIKLNTVLLHHDALLSSKLVDTRVFSNSASASVLQLEWCASVQYLQKCTKLPNIAAWPFWIVLDCCFEELVSLIPALLLALKPGDVAGPCKNIPESTLGRRSQKLCALGPRFAWTFVLHPGQISRNHAALT